MKNYIHTIGYEGKSTDDFIELLLKNKVKNIIDIRYNPFSFKKGFNKSQLKELLKKHSIDYYHIKDLGIPGGIRRKYLKKDKVIDQDYDKLFIEYRLHLRTCMEFYPIIFMLNEIGNVALMCFEKNVNHCHRKILSKVLKLKAINL